ncbi:uncharacterized protein LTR77_005321 [Saxophila tyrrhenica]|uniref:RING-type domain-containing protein n=1 Tax=Saxophila tyrrhenica TaxID=1690608 RepID=A0AAV9P8D4_9PEZI|nr:hypothetical protein LTR77_005321 [Saxophila tyrrhenica]
MSWRTWLATATLLLGTTAAQTFIPTNWTAGDAATRDDQTLMLQISLGDKMVPLAPVLALTRDGYNDIPPTGLSGPVIVTDPANALNLDSEDVALISCDDYSGEIQADDVFRQAYEKNVTAIVLYSEYSDWCHLMDYSDDYPWVYTLKNSTDTAKMLNETQDADGQDVYAAIGTSSGINGSGPAAANAGHQGQGGDQDHPPGTPSTAVAMIILYSITGIISALFVVIIVTGAMRAHRHPERYGPRNVIGRPRQSRARGLARAVVDTLPLVKVGEGQREAPKPADVELAENGSDRNTTGDGETRGPDEPRDQPEGNRQSIEDGIAAAITAQRSNSQSHNPDNLGCSICTEDFQAGEDQRVLPCDHRFHPACVDPWLLNVSGTCPLCRIDLRPPPPEMEDTGEVDEHGNPILREVGADPNGAPSQPQEPPPRMGYRRSLLEGIRDIGRPNHRVHYGRAEAAQISREERLAALRRLREQRTAQRREAPTEQAVEEERSTRQRLRRVFGIRTRRTGSAEPEAEGTPGEGGDGTPQSISRSRFAEGFEGRNTRWTSATEA